MVTPAAGAWRQLEAPDPRPSATPQVSKRPERQRTVWPMVWQEAWEAFSHPQTMASTCRTLRCHTLPHTQRPGLVSVSSRRARTASTMPVMI